jgi:twitching motility protein PilT
MAEVAPEPIVEVAPQPMAEVAPEPIVEVAPQPIAEVAPEPIAELAAQPMAEAAPEPIAEVTPQQIAEAAPEPIAEVAPEPVAYPTQETVAETAPEPIPIVAAIEEPAVQTIEETVVAAETIEPPIAPAVEPPAVEQPAIAASIEPPPMAAPSEPAAASEPAVVLPLTRTVRIEVPPRSAPAPAPASATTIDRLLRIAAARGASALFLSSDSRPCVRVEGDLRFLDSEGPLSRAAVESAILEIAPIGGDESIGRGEPTEWVAEFADVGRVRCSTFTDHRGPGVLLRLIATRAASADQLGLSRDIQALATEPQGIVLVAGPRGSGKSTLISALVDVVNRQRAEYVITLERQVRLLHDNKSALLSQREIHGGADDAVIAARAALRENPDVLVVDDLVSPQMVPLILKAAADGLLIFVSITAPSTSDAVQRFVELAPPETRKAVQSAMAEHFRGAVAQILLKRAGGGLVAAREVLLATAPVTRVISEGHLGQLPVALDEGRKHGMVSFTHTLVDYVRTGAVDVREAFRKSPDRDQLLESLKRGGIDVSAVERLA